MAEVSFAIPIVIGITTVILTVNVVKNRNLVRQQQILDRRRRQHRLRITRSFLDLIGSVASLRERMKFTPYGGTISGPFLDGSDPIITTVFAGPVPPNGFMLAFDPDTKLFTSSRTAPGNVFLAIWISPTQPFSLPIAIGALPSPDIGSTSLIPGVTSVSVDLSTKPITATDFVWIVTGTP